MSIALIARTVFLFYSQDFLISYKLPDDAFYYFTIAKQFALGNGLSFDGISPTNGYHPLWMMMILPVYMLGLSGWSGVIGVLVLQTILDLAIVAVLYQSIKKFTAEENRSSLLPFFVTGIYALHPTVLIRSINGLETTVTALVLLLWSVQYITLFLQTSKGSNRDAVTFGALSGLLFLARTDMIVILLIGGVWLLFFTRQGSITFYALSGITALAVVTPWLLWNYQTFGSIMQVSADAVPYFAKKKLEVLYPSAAERYFYLIKEAVRNIVKPFVYALFGVPLLTAILMVLQRKKVPLKPFNIGKPLFVVILSSLMILVYHSIARGFIRDWYVEQFIPLFLFFFGWSVYVITARYNKVVLKKVVLKAVFSLSIIALAGLWIWEISNPRYPSQTMLVETGVNYMEQLPKPTRVAALNSGVYGYFAPEGIQVFNLDGVVNPKAFQFMKRGDLRGYLQSDSINYLLEFPTDLRGYQNLIDPQLLDQFEVMHHLVGNSKHPQLAIFQRIPVQ